MIDNQKADPQDKKPDPIVPSEPITAASEANANEPTQTTEKLKKKKEPYRQKFVRRWLIVGFTALLTLYTALLYTTAVQQTNDATKSANAALKAAIAAEKSAAIAESSLAFVKKGSETQEKFAKIETRAYIVVTFDSAGRSGEREINFDWASTNVGKTPAYGVLARPAVWDHEPSIDEQLTVSLPMVRQVIGAGVRIPRHFYHTADRAEIDNILNSKIDLYITVKIRYEDIFGDIHHTYFHALLTKGRGIIRKPTPSDN